MPRKIPQILTVDDDAVTCELLCEVFAREGFGAVFANSGEAALNVVSQQRPDLLLSDIRMKTPLDGLSLLEIVRREYPSVPVVLMTAYPATPPTPFLTPKLLKRVEMMNAAILRVAATHGATVFPLDDIVAAHGMDLPDGLHMSVDLHRVVGEQLAECLVRVALRQVA